MKKNFFFIFTLIMFSPLAFSQDANYEKFQENIKKELVTIDYDQNAQVVDHPIYGVIALSFDRWKDWLVRSSMIVMFFISALIVALSIPKDNEINIIISYSIVGAMFSISFWTTLAGWMLMRLDQYLYGILVFFISMIMYAVFYIILLKIKKYDLSFSSIKEAFLKVANSTKEDIRLISVSATPSEWEKEDFLK